MKKVIVSGANGFVGNAVVRQLLERGVRVWALDRGALNAPPCSTGLTSVQCELAHLSTIKNVIPADEYDAFFHFAWAGVSGPGRADAALQLQNAQWTVDALRLSKELGCRRFVGAGSIMEQESLVASRTQGHRPGPGYVYGGAKLAAHLMCMPVGTEIGIDVVWPVLTNAYGVGELSSRMVNTAIRSVIAGEPPRFTAATQNYDFVYIDDVARAFCLIGEKGKPFHEYLIGSSTAGPLRDFLMEMKAAIAPDLDFIFGEVPFTGISLGLDKFDCSQTERDTGFRAEISFGEGVKRTKNWIQSSDPAHREVG